MTLATMNLTPRVGTEIKADAKALLSGSAAAEIRALLEQRGVLIVRNIGLEDAQQLALAKALGTVRFGTVRKETQDGNVTVDKESEDGIFKVTFDKTQNPMYAEYLLGTFCWHMDGTFEDVPPLASILTPRVLSPTGGQTEFANTYAAYEDLPESEKTFLDGLEVVHTMEANYREVVPNPTVDQLSDWRTYPQKTHPLVWHHRSGRKSLVLSSSSTQVVGMDLKESDALLRRLKVWATQAKYVYQHQWKMGDLLMWDNTGTMHRVLRYDLECGRRLHRVTLIGEESLAAA
ncbi:MAG: TauD/TfdA family dioxygenase [Rhodospirillaceae bacterium]|nr:MAG: TauD/TfdA family dioxygenase [Rhodospirillaceae bacterium]